MEHKKENKICQNCKKDFAIEPNDFGFYEKIKVPVPTFCPECRLQRRLAWRNEKSLHYRECGLCKKKIISIYSKDYKKDTIYCDKCWWGDDWNASDYAMDIDFSRPFFDQIFELFLKVPIGNLFAISMTMINSQYCNMANDMKNCYLLHDGTFDEDISYGSGVFHSKDSQDITMVDRVELSYETVTSVNCYRTFFSQNCEDCVEVYFSYSLRGCNNCFGCVNLHKKSYHIWNAPYTKEEYEEKLKSFGLDSYKNISALKEKAKKFWKKFPKKYYFGVQNSNVTGDYIVHSKNAKECFCVINTEDSKFCSFVSNGPVRTTYDFTHYGDNIELVYECLQCGNGTYNIKHSWGVWSSSRNIDYSIRVVGGENNFACVGLKKKEYCILNKQYTKEEYEELVPKIIKHMNDMPYMDKKERVYKYGEFFPVEFSPYGYNETTAQEYFPLNKEKALASGYNWKDREKRDYKITKKSNELPDSILQVEDSILEEVIGCEHEGGCEEDCMTAFRILPEDLQFYKRMNLPLPRLCPNCRHYQRMKQKNPMKLWHRVCMCDKQNHFHGAGKCEVEFETSYAPDRPEIIYCEKCYQQEVY
ncbi:MAG: hypothetical protein PHT16_03075 [Candidatus Pacebacteria bacterium]|nr:hypothetical protein [Candidatus Paceibacterota bacterium]